jgi:hypothetical protein
MTNEFSQTLPRAAHWQRTNVKVPSIRSEIQQFEEVGYLRVNKYRNFGTRVQFTRDYRCGTYKVAHTFEGTTQERSLPR